MIPKTNKQILQELNLYFQWKPNTYKSYRLIINAYCKYHQLDMYELIQEAEEDEENINKVNKRRIKNRMLDYVLYLKQEHRKDSTIKIHLNKIGKVYKYYDIDLPHLPKLPSRQKYETYTEIPTKEDIKNILLNTTLQNKMMITFLASSGMRVGDACNLTIGEFKQAVRAYTTHSLLVDTLSELEKNTDLILPKWGINSQKTGVKYITFNSDESTRLIIQYLKQRLLEEDVTDDMLLFGVKVKAITTRFQRINDELAYQDVNGRRFFHAHVLRKYFTTTLYNEGVDFLCVDFLVGHTLKPIQASYYKANPDYLQQIYKDHLSCFTFLSTVEVVKHTLNDMELEELQELRKYKLETDKRLEALELLVKSTLK